MTVSSLLVLSLLLFVRAVPMNKVSSGTVCETPAVLQETFADPCMIKVEEKYYAFAINLYRLMHINVPVAHTKNFQSNWTVMKTFDALPDTGLRVAEGLDG